MISTMAKVTILIALSYMLTLVSSVRVVHAPGTRGKKLKEMEAEPRHFPHSSVTKHTSAHTRLPQKGVFGKVVQLKFYSQGALKTSFRREITKRCAIRTIAEAMIQAKSQKYGRFTGSFLKAPVRACICTGVPVFIRVGWSHCITQKASRSM